VIRMIGLQQILVEVVRRNMSTITIQKWQRYEKVVWKDYVDEGGIGLVLHGREEWEEGVFDKRDYFPDL
jgi:hypothetical protein